MPGWRLAPSRCLESDRMPPVMDSRKNQAFVMVSVAEFCTLWATVSEAVLRLESINGQATGSLQAGLGRPGDHYLTPRLHRDSPHPLFPSGQASGSH